MWLDFLTHNYKYLEILILMFKVLYLGKENKCLYAICHNSIAIHSLSMHYATVNG